MAENNMILNEKLTELIRELKQAQAEVEELLSKKVTKASIESFRRFEKLLRKTSEMEEFSWQVNKEAKEYLRVILKDGTKVYNDFLEYARIRQS
jgi:hypothetical protein